MSLVTGSVTSSGTMAEASQNLTAPPGGRRAARRGRWRVDAAQRGAARTDRCAPAAAHEPRALEPADAIVRRPARLDALETSDGLVAIDDEDAPPGAHLLR
jgi:hypothetical protein